MARRPSSGEDKFLIGSLIVVVALFLLWLAWAWFVGPK